MDILVRESYGKERDIIISKEDFKSGVYLDDIDFFNSNEEQLEAIKEKELGLGDFEFSGENEGFLECYVSKEQLKNLVEKYKYIFYYGDVISSKDVLNFDVINYYEYWDGSNHKTIQLDTDYEEIEFIDYIKEDLGQYNIYKNKDKEYYIFYDSYFQGSLIDTDELITYTKEEVEEKFNIEL